MTYLTLDNQSEFFPQDAKQPSSVMVNLSTPKPERADAQRKRAQICAAAAEVFAEKGLSVTLDTIARHAGVGIGTVYRKYDSVPQLAAEVFAPKLEITADTIENLVETAPENPWEAFEKWVWHLAERTATDLGLSELMLSHIKLAGISRCQRFHTAQMRTFNAELKLFKQLSDSGLLRPGFNRQDMGLLLHSIVGIMRNDAIPNKEQWRRLTEYMLAGYRNWEAD